MAKEFKIGVMTLLAGAVFYYGFNFLKGQDFLAKTSKYYVVYDNVDGLKVSNPVVINGLAVGKVSATKFSQKKANKVVVELTIDEEITLGDSTVAELSSDLLGGKSILLKVGPLENKLLPNDTLIAYVDEGLTKYLESVEPVANSLIITITRINEILLGLEGAGEKINNTIGELETTVREVNTMIISNKLVFKETLEASRQLVLNLNQRVKQLDPILSKTSSLLDTLQQIEIQATLDEINQLTVTINSLASAIERGEGTVGKLVKEDSVYQNLNKLLIDLDKLTIHFNQYPKDFLKPLGRKHSKLKGIEKEPQGQ